MKKRNLLLIASFVIFIISTASVLYSGGYADCTNSPGEPNCTDCHGGNPLNSGGGSISLSSNITGGHYNLGQTYTVNVTIARTGAAIFGFDVECLDATNFNNAGTFVITNATETQTMINVTRVNVTHQSGAGIAANTKTYSFNWTAPATDIGNVKFYFAGVAGNNNSSSSGDYVYADSLLVHSPATSGISGLASGNDFSAIYDQANHSLHFSANSNSSENVQEKYFPLQASSFVIYLMKFTRAELKRIISSHQIFQKEFIF